MVMPPWAMKKEFKEESSLSASTHLLSGVGAYMGSSLTRKRTALGSYSRSLPRTLRWSQGGGRCVVPPWAMKKEFKEESSLSASTHLFGGSSLGVRIRVPQQGFQLCLRNLPGQSIQILASCPRLARKRHTLAWTQ